MKFTELETKYWVKVWSSAKMKARTGNSVAFFSYPKTCEALFTPQDISRSLAESFKLEDDEVQEASQQDNQPANTSAPVNRPQSDQATSVSYERSLNMKEADNLQASMSSPQPSARQSKQQTASLSTPRSENPRGRLDALVDNHSTPNTSRSKRRKIQSRQMGKVSWDDLEDTILDSD
jgi:hypothetical protein